jgi:hypothetical protein
LPYTETSAITRRPALTQSIKGIITAGPVKSFQYSMAKVGKWQKGTKQIADAAAAKANDKSEK